MRIVNVYKIAFRILNARWFKASIVYKERCIMSNPTKQDAIRLLDVFDPEMADLLHREEKRQFETIGLIASENVVSNVMSSVEVEQPVNTNAKAMSDKISFKRLLFIECSLFILLYYSLFNRYFQIIFIVRKSPV